MPPRARATSGPEFMSSATLGDLIAAELEQAAAPSAPQSNGHDGDHGPGVPALTPRERARQSMLHRAAAELREHHEPAPSDPG